MRCARLVVLGLVAASCHERAEDAGAGPSAVDEGSRPGGAVAAAEPIAALAFKDRSGGLPGSGNYAAVAMADLDGDGIAEILSGRRDREEGLFVFRFQGGKWALQQLTASGEYGGVAWADVTGDGVPDALAVKTAGRPKGLELFETRRDREGLEFEALASPYTDGCDDLDTGDLDGDGDTDLVYTSNAGLHVGLNDGKGTFGPRLVSAAIPGDRDWSGCCVADWDSDGDLDIAVSSFQGEGIRLLLNTAE